jgi:hypothetical protein
MTIDKEMVAGEAVSCLVEAGLITVNDESWRSKDCGLYKINTLHVDRSSQDPHDYTMLNRNKIADLNYDSDNELPFAVLIPHVETYVDVKINDKKYTLAYETSANSSFIKPYSLQPDCVRATQRLSPDYDILCKEIGRLCTEEGIKIKPDNVYKASGSSADLFGPTLVAELEWYCGEKGTDMLNEAVNKLAFIPEQANDHHGIYRGQILTGFSEDKVYTNKDITKPEGTVVHPREAFVLNHTELANTVGSKVDVTYTEGKAKIVGIKEKTVVKTTEREL